MLEVAGAVIATLLILVAEATHSTGVTSVGVSAKTRAQLPVSSLITHFSCKEVVDANCESGFDVNASPTQDTVANSKSVSHAFTLTTLSAFPVYDNPARLVSCVSNG